MPDTLEKGTGALLDTRDEALKLNDFRFEEAVASAASVNWVEKTEEQWRKFPIFDQNGSGSCVAQTLAKLLGILYWLKNGTYVHFSATHIYQRRFNKPSGGMAGVDALDIARRGVTLEVLTPSQRMTDEQMDSTVVEEYKHEVGSVFKIGNYLVMPARDIDLIASTIQQTKKGVMVWFYFTREEWDEVPDVRVPNLDLYAGSTSRHSVTAVDFTLYKGKKALIIEDSWGHDAARNGRRIITEDFFKARNWFAAYPIAFKFDGNEAPVKPRYTFSRALEFSATFKTDPDVVALQDILKYEGLFPANIDSTGYYGAITAKAVDAFQRRYAVAPTSELDALKGKRVGGKTIAKLNELYGN